MPRAGYFVELAASPSALGSQTVGSRRAEAKSTLISTGCGFICARGQSNCSGTAYFLAPRLDGDTEFREHILYFMDHESVAAVAAGLQLDAIGERYGIERKP